MRLTRNRRWRGYKGPGRHAERPWVCFCFQAGLTGSDLCLYRSLCLFCIPRLAAIFAMIPLFRTIHQARYTAVTYSATGAASFLFKHETFCSSVPSRATTFIDAFPHANRACAHCVEGGSRAPRSQNSERPTSGMTDPKQSFVGCYLPHRARRAAGPITDGTRYEERISMIALPRISRKRAK